jgi:hypothetical protein
MKLLKAFINNIEARVYLLAGCLTLSVLALLSPKVCLAALNSITRK